MRRKILLFIIFILLFSLRLFSIKPLSLPEGKLVTIRFDIDKEPYRSGSYQVINTSHILVRTAQIPGYYYGQRIEVTGKFTKRVINKLITKYEGNFPKIVVIEPRKNFNVLAKFIDLRKIIEDRVREYLPAENFALLMGVTFGQKTELPQELMQKLRKTGTTHIVVASGQNLTLLAGAVLSVLLVFLKRKQAIIVCLTVLMGYVLLTGAQPPILRSGMMIGIVYLAMLFGREADAGSALLAAGGFILLFSPLMLFDVGFQLSFAATAGLVWIQPVLMEIFRIRKIGEIREIGKYIRAGLEIFSVSLAAQITIFPIIMMNFGETSVLSPIINCFVLWLVAPIMIVGSVLAICSFVLPPVALILSWISWFFTQLFIEIIRFFGDLPLLSVKIKGFSLIMAGLYYVAVAIVIHLLSLCLPNKKHPVFKPI